MWSVMIPRKCSQFRNLIPPWTWTHCKSRRTSVIFTLRRIHPFTYDCIANVSFFLYFFESSRNLFVAFSSPSLDILCHRLVDSFEFSFQFNFRLVHIYFWIDNIFGVKAHGTTNTSDNGHTYTPSWGVPNTNTILTCKADAAFILSRALWMQWNVVAGEWEFFLFVLLVDAVVVVVVNVVQFIFRAFLFGWIYGYTHERWLLLQNCGKLIGNWMCEDRF